MSLAYYFTVLGGIAGFALLASFLTGVVMFRGLSGTWTMPHLGSVLLGALNLTVGIGVLFTIGVLVAAGSA